MVPSRRVLYASCAVVGLVAAGGGGWVLADDFVISTPVTTTNGGNTVDGNDTITVTGTGSVTTAGTDGLFATGNDNTITNSGSVTTSGVNLDGIYAEDGNTITNSGSVTTSGSNVDGIYAEDGNTITNSGSVTTSGSNAEGIVAIGNNTITNSGSVTTLGPNSEGIYAEAGITMITNSGSVTTSGDSSYGIYAEDGATITNSGSVTTSDEFSAGIVGRDGNTITNSGSVTTSGDNSEGIDADDGNTITNSGTVTTSGDSSEGIDADGNNTITNSGSVTTSGDSSEGIDANDNNTITNSGSVTTLGDSSYGIYAEDGNTITNSGSVTASGNNSGGIRVINNNTITSSGSVTTSEDDSQGLRVFNNNTITNSGSVTTSGDDSEGIFAGDNNTITNSGSVTTSGESSEGIDADDNNTITNSGIVTTSGETAYGIFVFDNNTITNSGKVVSAQAQSFELNSNNTLILNAPSFIGGEIDLGTNTTVNIVSGPSHSILWDLSTGTMDGGAPTLSGPVPIFYNAATQQVATFDPTALSGSANALGDMTGNLSALMRQRLSASQAGGGEEADASFVSAYAASPEQSGNAAIDRIATAFQDSLGADTGWWVSGFGSYADYDGNAAALDHGFDHVGVAAGYDWQHSADLTLGAMVGYGMGSFDADSRFANAFDNSADGAFAAFYGRADFAHSMFVDFALSGGLLSHSDTRFVNDNLAPLGVSSASADYDSWWLAPEMTLGMAFSDVMGSRWSYIPSASLRYAMQSVDGYTETGPSAANATVSAHDIAVLETRLELAARRDFELATLSGHVVGRLGWQHRAAMGDDAVAITMIGQNNSVSTSTQDASAAYLGLDASMDIGDTASLALGAEYRLGDSVQAMRGMATLTIAF
jgi:uncharacterized protein with beta-barrel porin domain